MKTKTKTNVKKICLTGLMAAMVTVCTAFIKIPTGINAGYLHFGDSMIYISGCILGPWALFGFGNRRRTCGYFGRLASVGDSHRNHKGTQCRAVCNYGG